MTTSDNITVGKKINKLSLFMKKRPESNLRNFNKISSILLFAASIFQCVFFTDIANITCVLYVLAMWIILINFFLHYNIILNFPLSSFLIIGFVLTQFYFPLIFTLFEGKPLVFNLSVPYEVFLHSSLQLIVLLTAHYLYRSYQPAPRNARSVLYRMGFFTPPTETQMWLMGIIGILANVYLYFYSSSQDINGAGAKFIQGFIPFAYTPFFIPLGKLYGSNEIHSKRFAYKLIIFIIILFLISIGRNSRGAFMFGFTGLGFSYALGLLLGFFTPRFFTVRNFILFLIGYWIFTGPMADLATAMIILRGSNSEKTRTEMIMMTWKTYNDKDAIQNYRSNYQKVSPIKQSGWNEYYLDDVFLSRFANVKFNDESLIQSDKIGKPDKDMLEFSENRIIALFPTPILGLLDLNSNKLSVEGASYGDYLYFKAGAGAGALGGLRSANLAGTGMATFGWWYLLVLGITTPIVFFLLDKFIIKQTIELQTGQRKVRIRFSLAGLLIITSVFLFMSSESVVEFLGFILRGWIQIVFLYYILFKITAILGTRINKNSHSKLIIKPKRVVYNI